MTEQYIEDEIRYARIQDWLEENGQLMVNSGRRGTRAEKSAWELGHAVPAPYGGMFFLTNSEFNRYNAFVATI